MSIASKTVILAAVWIVLAVLSQVSRAADKDDAIRLADGKLQFKVPEKWERKEPRSRIVEHEFAVEGKKGQEPGRVTVMSAGGTIEANIDRWIGQFKQPNGKNSKDTAKTDKKKIAGIEVHLVDIAGTYKDMPAGPFAGGKSIDRENYRMLAAIISGGPAIGNYFIKFYGPAEIVSNNEKAFHKMIDSLERK